MEKTALMEALGKGVVTVTFTKKDGTERTMRCTRSTSYIPIEHAPKSDTSKEEVTDNIRVFDVEKQGWRSFNFTTLKA